MNKKSGLPAASISNLESQISNHIIYTGSFSALEIRWMDVVADLQRDDPLLEINVLVGSNILATYLKRRYAQTGRPLANIRFLTFLDLANRLAGVAENDVKKARLPSLGSSIILEDLLAAQTPPVFASLSGFPGFRDALLDTFRDLRDAEISPQELSRTIETFPEMKDRREHLAGLADLYRRYRDGVSLFHDVDDDFRAAIRNAPEAHGALGSRQLLVYGIYDATGQQIRLLGALRNFFDMVYFIPHVNESISGFVKPFLQSRARELGVEPIQLPEKRPAGSLDRLAGRGFGLTHRPDTHLGESLSPDQSFALISAPGESRSAIEIVREVFRAVRDGTIRGFHEAAVILRQPENDIPIISEILRLRGIPYFICGGSSFADRPLSRAIVAVSGLEANSFSREAVLNAMELIAASLPEKQALSWDVQTWRSLTNDPRFLAGVQSWDIGTEALVGEARRNLQKLEASGKPDPDEEETSRGIPSPKSAARRLETAASLRDGWQLLRKAASGWPASLAWADWADYIDRHIEPLLGASEDWAYFSSVLDGIRNLQILKEFEIRDSRFDNETVSVDRLRTALVQSIASLSFPAGHFQRTGINLLSTSAARGLQFPLVIIPGLDEGRFPAKLRQDPLLLDSERRRMESLPIKSMRMEEEKLLFDMAARSAEKRLVLITSRLEESSDRERIPSQFFLRAAAAIRGTVVSIRDLNQGNIAGFRSISLDNPAPLKNEIAVDEGEIRLRLITSDRNAAQQALKALEHLDPIRFAGPIAYQQARWIQRLTPYDGFLTDSKLKEWASRTMGAAAGQVSASRLEEYAKCPYYFFLKRGMELELWEEAEPFEAIDPLERGTIVHSILETFLKDYCGEKFLAASEEKLRQDLNLLARDILEKSRPAGLPALLWEIECDSLLKIFNQWLAFEKNRATQGLLPARLEQPFGEFPGVETFPPFRLRAGKYTFDFRGRIDRIDVSRDGKTARVVDYKTGSLPDSMSRKSRTPLMSGERIQVAVYRGALSVLEDFREVETVAGEYLHLQPKDGRIVPCSFTDEELQQALERLSGILEITADGIDRGAFFIRTSGILRPSGHCDFCDYLTICGKDRLQREERKIADPAVQNFLRIVEPQP
ncbi:MAG: exodeoxyribonuclease V subunit gamma [Acidobacteria bacterium]|nr:exodeoxyribonuclease V subunit gamma [Acidobacteriota bacterium]